MPSCAYSSCSETFGKFCLYRSHIQRDHESRFNVEAKALEFGSWIEFESWLKNDVPHTGSRYAASGFKPHIRHYKCHLSGTFKPRGSGLREAKSIVTYKMGIDCPSQIVSIL